MSRKKNRSSGSRANINSDRYWQSYSFNQRCFMMYRDWIQSLALNRFKWVGLPDTCDARFLEYTLLTQGMATIAAPKKQPGTFYSTQVVPDGTLNVYDNPTKWRSFGNNGWTFDVTPANGVIVYDNRERLPIYNAIDLFARRLAAFDRTIDINLQKQHTPWIFTSAKERQNDLIQIMKQVEGGEPAILGTEGLRDIANEISAINVQVPFIGEELQTAQINEWNKVYAFLGINSLPKKSERMIEDEVNANNEPTDLRSLDVLGSRREACEILNKRFGLDIHVYWNQDYISDNYNMTHSVKYAAELAGDTNAVE